MLHAINYCKTVSLMYPNWPLLNKQDKHPLVVHHGDVHVCAFKRNFSFTKR